MLKIARHYSDWSGTAQRRITVDRLNQDRGPALRYDCDSMNLSTPSSADIYTVTRLNREVRSVLEGSFRTLWVKGEISNLAIPASGHMYFSLKDASSQVRCAMFKNRNRLLKFKPENGDEVLLQANVSLYEGRGEFQLIAQTLEPAGLGALQKAFEQLKTKLAAEGLFEATLKQPIPEYPASIGIVTSASGAAIRDILTTLRRRYPISEVIVYPTAVQGENAAAEIAAMIHTANTRNECDVVILARGGGSLEDLWSFNEEIVARAIHASEIPIVTGIGHEVDFTIADFVADLRAPTPTGAAEYVSPDIQHIYIQNQNFYKYFFRNVSQRLQALLDVLHNLRRRFPQPEKRFQQIKQRIDEMNLRLGINLKNSITGKRFQTMQLNSKLETASPQFRVIQSTQRLKNLHTSLFKATHRVITTHRAILQTHVTHLEAISPLSTLSRGFSISIKIDGEKVIQDASELQPGDSIRTIFKSGEIESEVIKKSVKNRLKGL